MTCEKCGGYVEWKGPMINLTHTECSSCGGINCQIPDTFDEDDTLETNGESFGDSQIKIHNNKKRGTFRPKRIS